ncbi:MAG: cold shock domain-containing protein [Caldilineales bacterium]|nr:cold shock domain-containing protein [Caldilineales bacterium]MDW8316589.1 cold shock domain-containing protein [Anaerolineae bacterium]
MAADRYLTCAACGVRFVWTALEQAQAERAPDRCPACRLLLPANGRRRGVVKFYNAARGWGFITPTEGPELFFHRSGLVGPTVLREGDLVEFAVEQTARGAQATEITRLEIEGE